MGLSKSDYLEQKLVEHAVGKTSFTMPTTVYVALFLVMPAEDGTGGTEVTGGSYARQAVTWGASSAVGGGRQISNSADLAYPTATADWATGPDRIVGIGLYDAVTTGNLLYLGKLSGPEYPFTVLAATDFFNAPANTFANTNQVVVSNLVGGAGLTDGTLYYIVGQSGTTAQLSLTSGGSAVNVTSDGTGNIALDLRAEVRNGYTFKILATNLKVTEY